MKAKQEYAGSQKVKAISIKSPSRDSCGSPTSQKRNPGADQFPDSKSSINITEIIVSQNNQKQPIDAIVISDTPCISPDSSDTYRRYSFSSTIPERYNETYIVAIPKDPNWLYVYWEFSDETFNQMDSMMDQFGSKLILRIKDTETDDTSTILPLLHIEINKGQDNHYFKVPKGGEGNGYQIECGHLFENGEFLLIAQSDPVSVPEVESEQQFFDTHLDISEDSLKPLYNKKNNPSIVMCNSEICQAHSSQYFDTAP